MKILQLQYLNNSWKVHNQSTGFRNEQCKLILAFGGCGVIRDPAVYAYLKSNFPKADLLLSSTSGEILNDEVFDDSISVTAIQFEHTGTRCVETHIHKHTNSYEAGKYLMKQLQQDDLSAVFILSDGIHVNGSELANGFNESNTSQVPVTGGLAGDGARFIKTFVGLNKLPEGGMITAIGFYGSHLTTGHGSFGGWDEFGPVRTITRAKKNVLYEIDGKNALDLYKEYLGPYKEELPGAALLFPLSIREQGSTRSLIRTIVSINEHEKTMVFAGNISEGKQVRLMKANFDKLIDGCSIAARDTFGDPTAKPDLAILISCVGRKLILQERTEEEVQAANEIFGHSTFTTGFYSYGELSPFNSNSKCELHNQTMTITTFTEH
jgi:hypothetical protein